MDQRARGSFKMGRTMSGAMFGGAALFWIVAGLLVTLGLWDVPAAGLASPTVALLIGAVLGLVACIAGFVVHAKVLQAVESAQREGWPPEAAGGIMTLLALGWALVMGPSLFTSVLLLVLGERGILWTAVPLCILGMALTAPRAEWFARSRL